MRKDEHYDLMRDVGYEWGVSAADATLSSIEAAKPEEPVQPYLFALDRAVAERAASLLDEGVGEALAAVWEQTARDAIGERLGDHDARADGGR